MSLVLKFRPYIEKLSRPLLLELEQLVVSLNRQRSVTLVNGAGTVYYLWVDATGDLRVGTSPPEEGDTGGTVVGGQS